LVVIPFFQGMAMRSGEAVAKTAEEYLERVPEPARSSLSKIRATIRAAVPADATEGISYGMPVFKYHGLLVGYAAFKNHCSFFPMNSSLVQEFKEELSAYKTAKGTIQFPSDKPLPAALLKKMVKIRVMDNKIKAKS
jgi:uncharacterized protein YdhG (YjbR/CyaY superfamily)